MCLVSVAVIVMKEFISRLLITVNVFQEFYKIIVKLKESACLFEKLAKEKADFFPKNKVLLFL